MTPGLECNKSALEPSSSLEGTGPKPGGGPKWRTGLFTCPFLMLSLGVFVGLVVILVLVVDVSTFDSADDSKFVT